MDNILNIAICEDNKDEETRLLNHLNSASIPNTYVVFNNAEDLLKIYKPFNFDLILMDIYLDGINGIDAISKIREIDEDVPVCFITTSKDFALESYRLSAIGYIEKPVERNAIEKILKLAKLEKESIPILMVHSNGKEIHIPLTQIEFIESNNRQLEINLTDNSTISVYEKLSDAVPQLDSEYFFQCHKSFCVNLNHINYIDQELNCYVMSSNKKVPIRRNFISQANQMFKNHLIKQTEGK